MWQLAGMTAVVGMGVVFASLFLLSSYMHFFKVLVAHVEKRSARAKEATPDKRGQSKPSTEAHRAGAKRETAPRPTAGQPALGPVVAAIAAALFVRPSGLAPAAAVSVRVPTGWRMSGQMASMSARAARQSRPRAPGRPLVHAAPPRRNGATKPPTTWATAPLGGRRRAHPVQ